jgi:hypothetical protein
LLITLAHRHPRNVICQKRPDEPVTGADYDLHFFSPGRYFGVRIQAKRLYHAGKSNWNYPSLDDHQATTLIGNPARTELVPLYCFYNWWDPPPNPHQGYHKQVCDFGCTVPAPRLVLEAMKTANGRYWHKTLRRHLPNMKSQPRLSVGLSAREGSTDNH